MIKKVLKIIFAASIFSIMMIGSIFAENISLNMSYGINNVAKNGEQLPLEIRLQNKDFQNFSGYILVNVYESNNSVYVYRSDIEIPERDEIYVNKNISITNRANTIIIEIYNQKEELITSERTNIDLSYFDDTMLIGALTSDFYSLKYIDGLSLYNNSLRTKLVEINEDMYDHNKNIFEQLDVLLISDIDSVSLGDGFKFAIQNFINNGKPVIVGLGGTHGIYTLPQVLYSFLSGPTTEDKYGSKKITRFDLIDGKVCADVAENIQVKYIKTNGIVFVCSPISFNDLSSNRDNAKIFTDSIETSLGYNRLGRIINTNTTYLDYDFYNISNLLNIIDKMKLPDIFIITIMLVFYVAVLTIIIYVYLRNINKRYLYGKCAVVFSIVFTAVMVYLGYNVMKKNTFLTYLSIVDIKNETTNETAFLNFRTSERGSYSFDTSANNRLYPVLKNVGEPILSTNFIDMNTIKSTNIFQSNNRINVNVQKASDFDSNIFRYENNNYLNDIYNIECSINRFNGEISGRITNNMDVEIKDASILMYGKVLKIGDIEPNRSVSLSRAINYTVPVGNNSMLSEILASGADQNFLKYYLDENIYEYYDDALLFGFIENNGTIDLNSNDIGDVYGKTMIVRLIEIDRKNNMIDICSLSNEVNNISGYYDNENNAISGDSEVINEYSFDNDYLLSNIYFENISSYDQGKLDFNVPFYGEIAAYNLQTNSFDNLYENSVNYNELQKYLTHKNKIVLRFTPTSMDPLYRRICLPQVRAVASR